MSVFGNTQVQQVASSVTPQEGIVDNRVAEALQDTAEIAGAGLSIMSSMKAKEANAGLQEFSRTLGNISQAFHQDPSKRTALRAQATRTLDSFVAGGGDAVEARKIWNAVIGSGGGSGKGGAGLAQDFNLFAETPEEKAESEQEMRVEELVTQAGLSIADAQFLAQQEKRDELARQFQPRNESEMAAKYQTELATVQTQFAINMDGILKAGNGSIDDKTRQDMLLAIDQQEALMKAELARDAQPTATKFYSPEFIRAEQDRITKTMDNFREMVNGRGDLEVLARSTETASLRELQLAQNNFPTIRILNQAGGQAYVQSYLEAQRYEANSALNRYWMDQIDPIARTVAGNAGTQAELSLGVYGKAIGGKERLNPFEADLTAKLLASQPPGSKLGEAMAIGAGENAEVRQNMSDVGYSDPQAAEKIFTQDAMKKLIQSKASEGYNAALGGVKSRVVQSFISETGQVPTDYINIRVDQRGRFYANFENSTQAAVNNIKSMYKLLEANPAEVDRLSKQAGQELSLEEALNFSLGIPLQPDVVLPEGEVRTGRGRAGGETLEVDLPSLVSEARKGVKGAQLQVLEALFGGRGAKTSGQMGRRRARNTEQESPDLVGTLSTLIEDPEFMGKSSEERLEELEGMGFDGSAIRAALGDLFGGGPDQE